MKKPPTVCWRKYAPWRSGEFGGLNPLRQGGVTPPPLIDETTLARRRLAPAKASFLEIPSMIMDDLATRSPVTIYCNAARRAMRVLNSLAEYCC